MPISQSSDKFLRNRAKILKSSHVVSKSCLFTKELTEGVVGSFLGNDKVVNWPEGLVTAFYSTQWAGPEKPEMFKNILFVVWAKHTFGLDLFAQVILNFFLDVECGGVVGGGKTTVGHELNVLKSPGGNPW